VDAWATLFVGCILVAMTALLGRVVQLKIAPNPGLAEAAGTSFASERQLTRRGDLVDRRGRVLATSTMGYRLFVDPQEVEDPFTIAVRIADLIDVDPVPIDRRLAQRPDSRYVRVVDLLESWQADAVVSADLQGVGLEPRLVRNYPNGELGAGILGKVGFDHTGQGGFEHLFDARLDSSPGRLVYLRDVRRRPMWVDPTGYRPGEAGEHIRLSIDLVVQEIAERHLRSAVLRHNAGGGRLVVLDCRSGELLAMADVLQSRDGWEEQTDDPGRRLHPGLARNRCVTDPYEPGSTFKPFIWSVATDLGLVRPEDRLPTPDKGVYRTSRGRPIRDDHLVGDAAWLTVLVQSINSGMAIVAERMTDGQMQEAVARFGFGAPTNCGVPSESPGIVTAPGAWTHYSQTSVAIGHEVAVTPVQMVRAFSVFARDGTMPHVRVTAETDDRSAYRFVHRVLPETTALLVRDALRTVMVEGTGRRAQSDRYRLFGKSGTAQLPRREGGGYHEHRYVSSFIAGAPVEEPRAVVLCVMDDPDRAKGHYGGAIAGPVVRDVMDEVLTYLGVEGDG
jgi:cell division protein FtsI/penicillin-binding protein 2